MPSRTRSVIAFAFSLALAAGTFGADKPAKTEVVRYPVPAGLLGFDGVLGGHVVSVEDHMRGFVLKVEKIVRSNAGSTAKDPQSAVGREVEINPAVTQDKNGHWIANERDMSYIKGLKKGEKIQIDVVNTDPHHLRIGSLAKAEK